MGNCCADNKGLQEAHVESGLKLVQTEENVNDDNNQGEVILHKSKAFGETTKNGMANDDYYQAPNNSESVLIFPEIPKRIKKA